MIEKVTDVEEATLAAFDDIIDVRAPLEYAEDHLPGAINLPVLNDAERAEVGTLYKQVSRFDARKLGASYVSRNIAGHLNETLSHKPSDYRPLIYCWRGGMRSGSMATILKEVGWRVSVLDGGYKTWRRAVVDALRTNGPPISMIVIDGQTGTAKSEVLAKLGSLGAQIIDLEKIAAHRGSVFGAFASTAQPSQKYFETQLWEILRRFDLSRPIFVEAESNRIGRCEVPERLWRTMIASPRIILHAGLEDRASYLVRAYSDMMDDNARIIKSINRLSPYQSKERIEEWRDLAHRRHYEELAGCLMQDHYDPMYDRSRTRRSDQTLAEFALKRLDDEGLTTAANEIMRRVAPAS